MPNITMERAGEFVDGMANSTHEEVLNKMALFDFFYDHFNLQASLSRAMFFGRLCGFGQGKTSQILVRKRVQ